jgi:hypothetical protein
MWDIGRRARGEGLKRWRSAPSTAKTSWLIKKLTADNFNPVSGLQADTIATSRKPLSP